ncbi:MAG: DegT/DnrJ/EryC1/StrS family aminotransferase, partial [Planctomycetaceae bacterium]|nr:DegT/DnrJ/EryC1/StrS family aminotransferase [Planctomycetaceae bacterium]
KLFVVEDAAQGVEAFYRDKPLGTLGHFGCYSFHNTKNYSCGEGGALLVNDERFIERASVIWEKGTNRSLFLMGQVDKYTWVDYGGSFLPSDLTAAFLLPQLEEADAINQKRLAVWNRYCELLTPLAEKCGFRLPVVPGECRHNAHMFYILLPTAKLRDELLKHLNSAGVMATFHYIPLHSAAMGRKIQPKEFSLPVTDDLFARLIRLPMYAGLTEGQMQEIVRRIGEFMTSAANEPRSEISQ